MPTRVISGVGQRPVEAPERGQPATGAVDRGEVHVLLADRLDQLHPIAALQAAEDALGLAVVGLRRVLVARRERELVVRGREPLRQPAEDRDVDGRLRAA
jgi:hypothetical protein